MAGWEGALHTNTVASLLGSVQRGWEQQSCLLGHTFVLSFSKEQLLRGKPHGLISEEAAVQSAADAR